MIDISKTCLTNQTLALEWFFFPIETIPNFPQRLLNEIK